MNILVPHSWLLEHLETSASPEEIQKYLSLCGPSVERIYEREGEPVYDIEVTTNRVDSMSVRGIAREAAVILPQFGVEARLKPLELITDLKTTGHELPLPKIKNDPTVCKRIMCVALGDVQATPTPDWMARRLKQIEANVHDSLIDITNYVTHDLGHPCHAFDYDQIMKLGGEIRVVVAKAGQPFTTLDGETYKTVGGEVVFENPAGEIIDLPAVKGTANTSITTRTRNILFWLEAIDHKKVRFASMTHAIRTVAAQLNEKQVDPHLAEPVLYEGVALYQKLCGAQVASPVFDEFPGEIKPITVTVSLDRISEYLGLKLEPQTITTILKTLECEVKFDKERGVLHITPPSFRPDLEIDADIVEEIARIYGYHNLPSTLMDTAIPLKRPENLNFNVENQIKHFLSDIGWQEVYTYSLVSQTVAESSGYSLAKHLKLLNPLTDDRIYLRRTLTPSLAEVLDQNSQVEKLGVFEIANTYQPVAGELPKEVLHLTLATNKHFTQLKGDIEALLRHFYVTAISVKPVESVIGFHQAGEVVIKDDAGKNRTIGHLGILKNGVAAADFSVTELLAVFNNHPHYQPLPKSAAIYEDMTFTLPAKTEMGPLLSAIKNISPLLHQVTLKDSYHRNYTLTLEYLDPQQNLSAEAVKPIRKKVASLVKTKFGGTLVGSL